MTFTATEKKVLAAHLFAWAVYQGNLERMVRLGVSAWTEVDCERLVRWALQVSA